MGGSTTFNYLVSLAEIISGIAAVIAIIISIAIYRHGLNRERKIDTLKKLSEIRRKYFNSNKLNDKEKLKYINELEYFATGINSKIYDIKIVKSMSGSRLIRQYEKWIKNFIKSRRKKSGNKSAYCEYEKMIKKIQK
ncbi:MAG: DUF4760 domain-containing protein [Firmicutes bacterium]|nr:DUF4760 domain-containing protein [Bacillota bacterium]